MYHRGKKRSEVAKFSLGGDEDGEGPSSPRPKRVRISSKEASYMETTENYQKKEEEKKKKVPLAKLKEVLPKDEEEEEEEDKAEEEADRACPVTVGSRANGSGQVCPEGSITVTFTDPEVLDCCICYEPLSTPISLPSSRF
ncbi:hypothetical protein CJ030_MR1G017499 [Morella rubra]|uniref:Uncharacterized protein n=1 Tax=Morella rubra TaxID=262757 RepID=A0A6A1WLX4_9ROSI|nr:hypothetical protein CJ030_MR1G017499 [Morella rubra]